MVRNTIPAHIKGLKITEDLGNVPVAINPVGRFLESRHNYHILDQDLTFASEVLARPA